MTPEDIIIVAVLVLLVGAALVSIRKAKKQGHCVGCPHAKECAAKRAGQTCDCQDKM